MDRKSSVGIPKTITSLWIGTTTKVRLAVVPLSSGCWRVRITLRCKHTQGVRKVETEKFTALTASGRSPERRRSPAEVRRRRLTGPTTTVLRGRNERIGSSGNAWRNWGYLAGLRQARKERWRQPRGRWRSERNSLAPRVGFEPTTLRLTAECSTIELPRNNTGRLFYYTKPSPLCQSSRSPRRR